MLVIASLNGAPRDFERGHFAAGMILSECMIECLDKDLLRVLR